MIKRIKAKLFPKQAFHYNIEQLSEYNGVIFIRGWAFFNHKPFSNVYYSTVDGRWQKASIERLPSKDVAKVKNNENAQLARFIIRIDDEQSKSALELKLKFKTGYALTQQTTICGGLHLQGIQRGPFLNFVPNFFRDYVEKADVKTVLEVGSRARSGINNREIFIPKDIDFTGVDVLEGEGVDVVCDAHNLSNFVDHNKYDVVYSLNVFEHLLMPWKVALEINKVMKQGGIVMIFTHHAYPLHDLPWDYFRFSDNAWHALFNEATGFEIVETKLLDPVSIVPKCIYEGSATVKDGEAYIHSAVIARKTSDTSLQWPVNTQQITETVYPE